MVLNEEGNLIRFGVPDGVPVSHKHGWIPDTHGDAGVVFTPGGDYVIVEYLHLPGQWLQSDISFPILREISRAVYNYFNFDEPYVGDPLADEAGITGEGGTIEETPPEAETEATPPTDDTGTEPPADEASAPEPVATTVAGTTGEGTDAMVTPVPTTTP